MGPDPTADQVSFDVETGRYRDPELQEAFETQQRAFEQAVRGLPLLVRGACRLVFWAARKVAPS